MARLEQNFTQFRGDNFTVAFPVQDAQDLSGYKAEWTVYERAIIADTHTITKLLTITTDHFDAPAQGAHKPDGITFHDNEVHVHVSESDYTTLGDANKEVTYDHQLRLWDVEDNHTVAAYGKWRIMVASSKAILS